jgi:hypothetical protein
MKTLYKTWGAIAAIVAMIAANLSAGEILSWDASPSGDLVTGYIVYYSATGTAAKPWPILARVPATQLSVTNTAPGRWFYYATATNACCESDPSEVAFRPGNPQNPKVR